MIYCDCNFMYCYMFSVIFVNFLVGLNKEQILLLSIPSIVRLLS
jgi:hypothetical protein